MALFPTKIDFAAKYSQHSLIIWNIVYIEIWYKRTKILKCTSDILWSRSLTIFTTGDQQINTQDMLSNLPCGSNYVDHLKYM